MMIEESHGKLFMEKLPGSGWYITSIFVEEGYRNQGIGSRLLDKALKNCGRPVFLFASPELGGNLRRLKKFYGRYGFEPYKSRRDDPYPYRINMALYK